MATMRERCRWCGLLLEVPVQAQTIMCPGCHTLIQLQRNAPSYGGFPTSYGYTNPMPAGNGGLPTAYGYTNPMPAANNVYPVESYYAPAPPRVQNNRRRALLCGVTYRGHKKSLKGSINNVKWIRNLLVENLGFPSSSILILTEDERDPYRKPTKANIRESLNWLVRGCQPGDSLFFYYSGHASQVLDRDGDEMDGFDESLCPMDYETEGRILDDEINEKIVRPLPRGVTLHALMDTCFSGTFLDLPFMCRMNRDGSAKWEDHRNPYSAYKGTSGGTAICISACDDHQNSADTTAFTGTTMGALTFSFIETLKQEPKMTYGRLLMSLRKLIDEAQRGIFQDGRAAIQVPQLSSSERFDIHSKIMNL
nr:metacaspase-3-like [Ipomoea trifida]